MSEQNADTQSTPSTQPQIRRRRGSVLFPILLIGLGVTLLTQSRGLVPWEIWAQLWRLWPVVLILIGLDIIIGRRSAIGGYLVGAIAVTSLTGIVSVATVFPQPVESRFNFSRSIGPVSLH